MEGEIHLLIDGVPHLLKEGDIALIHSNQVHSTEKVTPKPLIELSCIPEALKSSEETVFWRKGWRRDAPCVSSVFDAFPEADAAMNEIARFIRESLRIR